MKTLSIIALIICTALGLGSASATSYYVELTGDDANSGLVGSPWRTLTKACAEVPADQGHVIQIGEGTFTEAGILTLRSGVSLIGAGSAKTTLRVNHYFSLTAAVPNANPHVDTFPEQFVIQMNGQNQTVKGFALDGQAKTCHGGIFAALARNVVFEDLNVTNFRYCALWMLDAYDTTLRFSSFKNNTYGNRNSGDSGAVQYLRCFNLAIHDNRVEETGNVSPDLGGYALKAQDRSWAFSTNNVLDSMRIYNNTLIVPTVGAWENGLAPAISAEFLNVGMRNCEIYHNTINNTVSMAGDSRGTRNRIHHNFFNLGWGRYAYAIEASMSDLEIDQNHFYGGLYPIALWGGNPQNHNIHHNIFEGASAGGFAGQALLNYTAPITNLRFINNTVIDNGGIGQIFALHAASTYEARNNLIIHTAAPADIWGTNLTGTVSNNFFSNVTPRGTNSLTGAPGISYSLVNGTPLSSPYYTIQPGSPLLDAGQSISPWADDFTATAPDIGAIESGVSFAGSDYFVDPAGNDSATGTSEASAWKTLAKVNATTFQPGDRIRFKKGGTWFGSLWPKGSGNSTAQITLGSYGTGAKPLIDAQGAETSCIKLSDQEYWTIDGFEVTNWAATNGMRFGIRVEAGDSQVKHRIRILNNTVRDIYGIMGMPEANNTTGYWVGGIYFQIYEPGKADEILIEGNDVRNIIGEAISFWGEGEFGSNNTMNYANCSTNVVVRGNTVRNTSGDGILLYGTDNELVEYNEVAYVSELQTQSVNTAAAWPTRHKGGLWQYNHVHHTRRKGNDGTAFDNDGFTSGTTIFQHNVSHDNEGGFIMEYTWGGDVSAKTIARYNISWNDSRIVASNRGGMELYNNVFYNPGAPLGVEWTAAGTRVNFRNNLFVATGRSTEFGSQTFSNNTFSGGITRPTNTNNNFTRDPLFVNPNTTGNLAGFILQSSSSERGSGAIISGNGGKDFWGVALPATAPHRGASQINAIGDYTATPTFLTASGPFTATIPLSGTATLAFTAELRDQNFHLISPPAVTWSLSPAATGYSIDTNGVVTIDPTALPQRIAVIATNGSLTSSASFGTVYQTTDWDNGAGTGKWNATDANWSGSTWSDGAWAVFSHTATSQTITLEGTRSALRVDIGNGGNNANYTFASSPGASLTTDTFVIQGDPANDANSAPLTIFDNAAITVAGNLGIGRARLSIGGSSVIQAGTIGGGGIAFSPDWGYLTISGNANVTATNGIYGNTSAWGINLNGGTLTTKGINASDYSTLGAYLHFNGTTVRASESNPAFVTLSNGTKAYIGTGGANIDTNGQDIGIAAILADASSASPATNGGTTLSGTGFLTKSGLGTLVLVGNNTYNGTTTVNGGTLQIGDGGMSGTLGGGAVANHAALVFNRSDNPTVGNLMSGSGSVTQSGVGMVTLNQGPGTTGDLTVTAGQLTINAGAGWTIQNNLHISNGTLDIGGWGGNAVQAGKTITFDAPGGGVLNLASGNFYPANWGSQQLISSTGGARNRISGNINANGNTLDFNITRGTDPVSDLKVTASIFNAGSVKKTGDGILEMAGTSSYTGNTTVIAGTLILGNGTANSSLADTADVIVAADCTLHLNYTGTDTIDELWLGGVRKSPGIYGAENSSGFLTGTGTLTVQNGPALIDGWNADANGLWSDNGNWGNGIPDGSTSTANFTNDITADRSVSLDSARTLNKLVFSDPATATAGSWLIDNHGNPANILTLGGSAPTITVGSLGTGKTAEMSAILAGNTGRITKDGLGTLILSGANTYSVGMNITGGVVIMNNPGASVGGSTTLSDFTINGTSAFRQSAGTVTVTGANDSTNASGGTNSLIIGDGSYGAYTLSGGTLDINNPWRMNPRRAQFTQTGGTFNVSDTGTGAIADVRQFLIGSGNDRGVIYATGGSTNITTASTLTGAALIISDTSTSGNANGSTLTITGTADWTVSGGAGVVQMTRGNDAETAVLNINGGGRLTANAITNTAPGGTAGTSILNFNGGTLRAGASTATFLNGMTATRIYSGGATIDTNGHDITLAQRLQRQNPSGSVLSSVAIASGGSGYVAPPIVSITGGGGAGATAVANFDAATGTVTGITITSAGSGYTSTPTVTLSHGYQTGGTEATLGAVTIAAPVITGGLTKSGAGTLTLTATNHTYGGSTTVMEGTLSLAGIHLSDAADVIVAPGAMLDLNYTGTDQIRSLWVDGNQLPSGVYSASSAFLTGTGTLTVTTGPATANYAIWSGRGAYNLSEGTTGDDDYDGINNLLEYVLGGNPRAASSGILPTANASTGNLAFTFRRIHSTTADTTQIFQHGTDLSGWTDVPVVAGGIVAILPDTPQTGTDTVTITVPEGTNPRIFGRLKVSTPLVQP